MPVQFFADSQRERLNRFPDTIQHDDLITFFTLSDSDKATIPVYSGAANRLGFALQLCALRFMGFFPENLQTTPFPIVEYVASQLGVDPQALVEYGNRAHTKTDHQMQVMAYLGYRRADDKDFDELSSWLLERVLEHDKPSLLYDLTCEKLRKEKIIRPGITRLERLIAEARHKAQAETMRRFEPILTAQCRSLLDSLLVADSEGRKTLLSWLRQNATSNSPKSILENIGKLAFLKQLGVPSWNWKMNHLNPNHLKRLAQIARKSPAQTLQRAVEERRYPILIAFLYQSLSDITDETIDMFDRCLVDAYAHAGRDLDEFRKSVARETNEKVKLFYELGSIVIDEDISDADLRTVIFYRIPLEVLQKAVEESAKIVRPLDDSYFDFLKSRYSYLRQFIPAFLEALTFQSNVEGDSLLAAIDLLRCLNMERRRALPNPNSVPMDFIPAKWRPYVFDHEGKISRSYYELCVLWELRHALRAGNVWLESSWSRRYANPETYLIPKDRWPELKAEVCRQVQIPEDGTSRLADRASELEEMLTRVEAILKLKAREAREAREGDDKAHIRIENGEIVVSPVEAEERPASTVALEQQIDQMLPLVELPNLLIEVDGWTQFSRHFFHAGGSEPRSQEFQKHLYASILAQACNLGFTKMAQIADLSHDRLAWCNNWYIRDETLKAATDALVNFHYHQPLSQHWGGGTLSSSDGQRFPASGKVRDATTIPRYFGYGRGVAFYTWTSDQFSQYGTKVIPATVRDATYVLDAILDNETELSIMEHTTDTSGYTEIIFALFDLLGMQFSPRIRDLKDQRLYRMDQMDRLDPVDTENPTKKYPFIESQLKGKIDCDLILDRWDDLLRVAGSLKMGWVTASLFISKLQSYPRQNALSRALREYGRLAKTIFILRYLESEKYRRRINLQLNKGEALHSLRRFLFFAHEGKIRRKQAEEMSHQASCLNLVTNAVIAWNTVYMNAAIEQLKAQGYPVQESDLKHLSPARHEHINPYGKYHFEVEEELSRKELRPLRQ